MASPRSIFTLRFLLIAVAFAALLMAASRTGSITAITAACVMCLACMRISDMLAGRRAEGLATSRRQRFVIILTSAAIAAVIVSLADLAFVLGYFGYLLFLDEIHTSSKLTPFTDISLMGLVVGSVMALVIASRLKRFLWTIGSTPPKDRPRWSTLWPLTIMMLVGLWSGAVWMRERAEYCRTMVAFHASQEGYYASQGGLAAYAEEISYNAYLKDWYRYTMWCPWLPTEPPPRAYQAAKQAARRRGVP